MISAMFSRVIREWLTATQMQEVNRRNLLPNYVGACATHDFIDSNEAMLEAYRRLGYKRPESTDQVGMAKWDAAWDLSRKKRFQVHP